MTELVSSIGGMTPHQLLPDSDRHEDTCHLPLSGSRGRPEIVVSTRVVGSMGLRTTADQLTRHPSEDTLVAYSFLAPCVEEESDARPAAISTIAFRLR